MLEVVEAACAAGCPVVQLRNRRVSTRTFHELALALRRITRAQHSWLIVNDRIDVAVSVDADGAHLPESGMSVEHARAVLGTRKLLGRSVHAPATAGAMADVALDYLQFGPVYDTVSKRDFGPPQGLAALALAVAAARTVPVLAVGGIDPSRTGEVCGCGAGGIAVIGSVMGSTDPAAATASLLAALRAAGKPEPRRNPPRAD